VGFVLQGMKTAVAQAAEWWQGAVLIKYLLSIHAKSQLGFYFLVQMTGL
jgi:hypothetical protein